MKHRALWAAIVVVIAIVGFVLVRSTSKAGAPRGPSAASPSPADSSSSSPAAGPAAHTRSGHVTRLATAAERQEVADQIASAHAARTRQAPPQPPSLPGAAPNSDSNDSGDTSHDLERASPTLKAALTEAIPFLAECYKTAPITQRRPAVVMTLTGDPDVGTLIDAEQLHDQDGRPLDSELEGCLRTTLGSLELPPLPTANPLHIQYSFRFDDD